MTATREDVLAATRARFPADALPRVLALLDTYGTAPYEREVARVQLAILALSAGDEAKVRDCVAVARRDYRDVLYWAEFPGDATLDTPEKRGKVRALFEKLGLEPPAGLQE